MTEHAHVQNPARLGLKSKSDVDAKALADIGSMFDQLGGGLKKFVPLPGSSGQGQADAARGSSSSRLALQDKGQSSKLSPQEAREADELLTKAQLVFKKIEKDAEKTLARVEPGDAIHTLLTLGGIWYADYNVP